VAHKVEELAMRDMKIRFDVDDREEQASWTGVDFGVKQWTAERLTSIS